ncbi:hypothetical protein POTOM_037339 [Populus tomentosa]|uniref:Uncharacterized protein n=1 Tax=Populus tomentosa TaxID=118781 RepID=A0A8X7YYW6_POPTO|nr:hypothetical protein POTOM_037339 [Populus tomentosa]
MNLLNSAFADSDDPTSKSSADNPDLPTLDATWIRFKERTAVIRDVASRAVHDLPASLETSASVAQESLESVGQAIDDIGSTFWKSTARIISHGSDSVFSSVDHDRDGDTGSLIKRESLNVRYSRFDAQVRALQCDLDTYCCEPVDKEDYEKRRSKGLVIEEKNEEIKRLIRENELKQAEEARALLVKRAISGDEEEDLSWDFDGEEEESNGVLSKGKSSKDGDVVSSYSFQEEEDVGWDEIEDIGSNDESKVGAAGSNSKCWYRQS